MKVIVYKCKLTAVKPASTTGPMTHLCFSGNLFCFGFRFEEGAGRRRFQAAVNRAGHVAQNERSPVGLTPVFNPQASQTHGDRFWRPAV